MIFQEVGKLTYKQLASTTSYTQTFSHIHSVPSKKKKKTCEKKKKNLMQQAEHAKH